MPILLKSLAGLFTGVAVGALSLAYWPQVQPPTAAAARPLVDQPQRVAASPLATPAPVQVTGLVLEKAAVDKLAQAFHEAQPDPVGGEMTRGLTLASANVGPTSPSDEARRLRAQGLVALAGGDVAEARGFLERAADAGDARALLVLGDAYDPGTLSRLGALGVTGDASRARAYYQRASDAGVVVARQRIAAYQLSQ